MFTKLITGRNRNSKVNRHRRPRGVGFEGLEGRQMMSATPFQALAPAAPMAAMNSGAAAATDRIISINTWVNANTVNQLTGFVAQAQNDAQAIDSIMAKLPGWSVGGTSLSLSLIHI